jgi:hypothetical protein
VLEAFRLASKRQQGGQWRKLGGKKEIPSFGHSPAPLRRDERREKGKRAHGPLPLSPHRPFKGRQRLLGVLTLKGKGNGRDLSLGSEINLRCQKIIQNAYDYDLPGSSRLRDAGNALPPRNRHSEDFS